MKHFREELRYVYPITPQGLVVDVGAYHGQWCKEMARTYGCRVIAFEPVWRHFTETVCNTMEEQVCVINAAVDAAGSETEIGVSNDSSGQFSPSAIRQKASVVRVVPLIRALGVVDVLKLNCEGGELAILDILINSGLIANIKNVQAQFHMSVPGAMESYNRITAGMERTHEAEWDSAPVWQNWKLR